MKAAGRSLVLTPSNEIAEEISKDVKSSLNYSVFTGTDLEASKSKFTDTDPAVAILKAVP
jgi:hypothetical protein